MPNTATLKAVIFDLDGILVDTSIYHGQAWAALVRRVGVEPPHDLEERVKGISRIASLKIALGTAAARHSETELEEMAEQKNALYLEAIKDVGPSNLYTGALALFEDLKRAGIKIVLGSASKNAKPVLDSLGITEWFDAVADGFAYKHGKPNPDVFITGAARVGACPVECIVVEDAAAGINAALDGGFVAVGMGNYESLKHAHLFVNSLEELSAARLTQLHARFRSDRWTVAREGRHDDREDSYGTLFCVGNGRLGVRGRLAELPVGHPAETFVAGFYDRVLRARPDVAHWDEFMHYWGDAALADEEQVEACLGNCPDVLAGEIQVEGERVDFTTGELKSLRRTLDLFNGIFCAEAHWVSPGGRELRLAQRRFADMADTRRLFAQTEIEALNFSGRVDIRAGIDGHTLSLIPERPQQAYRVVKTTAAGSQAAAMRVTGLSDGQEAAFATGLTVHDRPDASYRVVHGEGVVGVHAATRLDQDRILYVDRVCVMTTQRTEEAPLAAAVDAVADAVGTAFHQARIDSGAQWRAAWESSDVRVEGDAGAQLGTRFSIYQLLIAASRDDAGVSIPAKALSGSGYRGMVFWDTDIHMTPFFNFTQPRQARHLAEFRYRTLAGARAKAAHYGFKGAFYPWETGFSGQEECEQWLRLLTHQVHITADVAYALQQYVEITGDQAFYEDMAAEVLIETARFWLSRAVESEGALSIPDAGGPDEFHVVGHDSAYVNNLAVYNLTVADRAVQHLRQAAPAKLTAIQARTGVTDAELAGFADAAARIRTMRRQDGVFEQCRGFFALRDEVVHAHGGRVFETQTVKQADVIMLLMLLPDQWPDDVKKANWNYYEPRCVHLSSLSHGAHGIVAAELGLKTKAARYIRESMGMDLDDTAGNAAAGAHMAAHGMNWVAVVRGYGGCRPQGDMFLIQPRLPAEWTRLCFRLKWRGADFTVDIHPDRVDVTNAASASAALPATLCGKTVRIEPGESVTAAMAP